MFRIILWILRIHRTDLFSFLSLSFFWNFHLLYSYNFWYYLCYLYLFFIIFGINAVILLKVFDVNLIFELNGSLFIILFRKIWILNVFVYYLYFFIIVCKHFFIKIFRIFIYILISLIIIIFLLLYWTCPIIDTSKIWLVLRSF